MTENSVLSEYPWTPDEWTNVHDTAHYLKPGERVMMVDRSYRDTGTVVAQLPPDDRPAYAGQVWFTVRWDATVDDPEGWESDHRVEGQFAIERLRAIGAEGATNDA